MQVDGGVGLLLDRIVGRLAQFLDETEVALVQHGIARRRRFALALDQRVGRERHRRLPLVGNALGNREHVVAVHRDLAREDEAVAVVEGQRDRGCRRELLAVGLPQRVGIGQGQFAALLREAGLGVVRPRRARRRQQHDMRRPLIERLAVVLQREIVEPAALQGDRADQRRRVDLDARAIGQHRLALALEGGRLRHDTTLRRGGARWLRQHRRRARLAGMRLLRIRLLRQLDLSGLLEPRPGVEILPAEDDEDRERDRQIIVLAVRFHGVRFHGVRCLSGTWRGRFGLAASCTPMKARASSVASVANGSRIASSRPTST